MRLIVPSTRAVNPFVLAAALAFLARAAVVHPETVAVRPLGPAAPATTARHARGTPASTRAMLTPAERHIVELRAARQREFLPLQRLLMAPDKPIDRSQYASRRADWRLPTGAWRDGKGAVHLSATGVSPPDTIRMAFLRIDFRADRGGSASTGDGHFDLSGPDTTIPPIDRAPHNRAFYESHARALERYYDVQSYGRTVFKIDVWPAESDSAYHLSDMADLGPWAFGNSVYRAAVDMFRLMFFAADSQSTAQGQRIPWQKYDRFMIIHAGGDLQSDVQQNSKEDIPSFTVFLGDTDRVVFPDSAAWNRTRPIDRASFVPETINQDGYFGALNGVIAHENGHNCFGFLDVYNIETGYPVCGYWTLMDSGNLLGSRLLLNDGSEIFAIGLLPPSIDPFQRNFIGGGMDIRTPAWGETLAVVGNERSNLFYKVPLSSDEYLLLENRFLSPADAVQLDADSVTHVVLGPKAPDRFEYDALEPGGGILVWKVDESVVPFDRSLRVNPDYGLNSNNARQGLQILEADGLDDLGDGGSPFIEGSPLDPYQRKINPSLSDSTLPNLLPNTGSRPHVRIDFLDDAADTMHFSANRTWSLPAFPVRASFPPGGPAPLAIDADGDRNLDICWAGGAAGAADSSALFAVRPNGQGLFGPSFEITRFDRRPLPPVAATLAGDPVLKVGPAVFAVTTRSEDSADTLGGRVWLVDEHGVPLPGWPVRPLGAHATTPPVIAGVWPNIVVFAGLATGQTVALDRNGSVLASDAGYSGSPAAGRLAFWAGTPAIPAVPSVGGTADTSWLAVGHADGTVEILRYGAPGPVLARVQSFSVAPTPTSAAIPEFLWLQLGGTGGNAEGNCADGQPTLIAHQADRLYAYCTQGAALPGWGRSYGDTLVDGLAAGDPDGDGFPEVLVQSRDSKVAFINRDGSPSPGWPKPSTPEHLPTLTPPLSLDVDGDGRGEVVVLNGAGLLAALNNAGHNPPGWPLATGAGAEGHLLAADLDRDGRLELVAPDRDTLLYAYSLPVPAIDEAVTSWTMLGGDPGRTSALPVSRTTAPLAASAGPLMQGSFKAFPNPARRKPVSFAYTLSEDADVEYRILDSSGHQVAAFARHGMRTDNVDVWDPGSLPAGLYVARVKFSGRRGTQISTVPVGLLR